jgi:hypothetical protein
MVCKILDLGPKLQKLFACLVANWCGRHRHDDAVKEGQSLPIYRFPMIND